MNAHLAIFGMVDGWFLARPVTVPRTDMGKRRYLRGIDSLYSYGGVVTSLGLASLVSFIASVSLEDPRKPFKRYVLQRGSVCGLFFAALRGRDFRTDLFQFLSGLSKHIYKKDAIFFFLSLSKRFWAFENYRCLGIDFNSRPHYLILLQHLLSVGEQILNSYRSSASFSLTRRNIRERWAISKADLLFCRITGAMSRFIKKAAREKVMNRWRFPFLLGTLLSLDTQIALNYFQKIGTFEEPSSWST